MASISLYLKHRVATSPLAAAAEWLRTQTYRAKIKDTPELSLLRNEHLMMRARIDANVKPGMSCLDIGAHIGSVAFQLERLAGKGQVKLIEAVPEKAAWLADRFGAENVIACAISDAGSTVAFNVNDANPGYSSLSAHEGSREIEVPAKRLDDLFPDETFDFVKIDVEGHELPVLRTGEALLARSRPLILFEAGPVHLPNAPSYEELFDWLTDFLGYDVFAVFEMDKSDRPLTRERFRDYRSYPFLAFNYFAVPRPNST